MQQNMDISSGRFVYVYFNTETVAYLIDMITGENQQSFLRVLESSSITNSSHVYRIPLDSNIWWQKLSNKKEIMIFLQDINAKVNTLVLKSFSVTKFNPVFQKMYFPFLKIIFSKIPTLHSSGPLQAKYETNDTSGITTILVDYYLIKNLFKSRWIYIAVVQGNMYFELAIAPVSRLVGALWLLRTPNLIENHTSMRSFMVVKEIKRENDLYNSSFDFWEIILGSRKSVIIKVSYEKKTFQILWADVNTVNHTINTTLEAKIELTIRKKQNNFNFKWERCLFELNGNIESMMAFFK